MLPLFLTRMLDSAAAQRRRTADVVRRQLCRGSPMDCAAITPPITSPLLMM